MTTGERLIEFRKYNNLKQKDIAELFAINPVNISDIENNKQRLSQDQLPLLQERYNLNINWLLTGRGPMLLDDAPMLVQIPIFEIQASAGTHKDALTEYQLPALEYVSIPLPNKKIDLQKLCIIQVKGNSMEPTLRNGVFILCQKLPAEEWQNIRTGEIYVIVTSISVNIKRLQFNSTQKMYTLVSDNEKYQNETVALKAVEGLYKVEAYYNVL